MDHLHITLRHKFTENCTVAVVDILHFNEKVYDFLARTCDHFSLYGCCSFGARQILKIVCSLSQNS